MGYQRREQKVRQHTYPPETPPPGVLLTRWLPTGGAGLSASIRPRSAPPHSILPFPQRGLFPSPGRCPLPTIRCPPAIPPYQALQHYYPLIDPPFQGSCPRPSPQEGKKGEAQSGCPLKNFSSSTALPSLMFSRTIDRNCSKVPAPFAPRRRWPAVRQRKLNAVFAVFSNGLPGALFLTCVWVSLTSSWLIDRILKVLPGWRNGRRSGLKIHRGQPRGSSSLPPGTRIKERQGAFPFQEK